jgi:hypothetical protein
MIEIEVPSSHPKTEISVCVDDQVITLQVIVPKPVGVIDPEEFAKTMGHLIDLVLAPEFARPYWGGDESVSDYV